MEKSYFKHKFILKLFFVSAIYFSWYPVNTLGNFIDQEPNAPANFQVVSNSCNSVTFSWQDILYATEESYEIYRSTGQAEGPYYYIGSSHANNLMFTDHTVMPHTTYFYYVKGRFGFGFGKASQVIKVEPNCPNNAGEIQNLSVYALNCSQLSIQWDDIVGFNEENYELYRAKDHPNNMYEKIGLPHQNQTIWVDKNLNSNTRYYYILRARFSDRFSNYSSATGQTTQALDLKIAESCGNKVKLHWEICSPEREDWVIYATSDHVSWAEIGRAEALEHTFEAKSLDPSKSYYFAVQPIYSNGFSNWSNTVHRPPTSQTCASTNAAITETLMAYPNPAAHEVNLKLPTEEAVESGVVQIMDVGGNVVQNISLRNLQAAEDFKISTSNLRQGAYHINLLPEKGNKTYRTKINVNR